MVSNAASCSTWDSQINVQLDNIEGQKQIFLPLSLRGAPHVLEALRSVICK